MTTPRPLEDYEGAAAYLGITARNLRSLKSRGLVPYVKVGRLVRFDLDELDRVRAAWTVHEVAA